MGSVVTTFRRNVALFGAPRCIPTTFERDYEQRSGATVELRMNTKLSLGLLALTTACGEVIEKDPSPYESATEANATSSGSGTTMLTDTAEGTTTTSPDDDTVDPTSDPTTNADETTTDDDESSSSGSTTGVDPELCNAFFSCAEFCDEEPECIEDCSVSFGVDIYACEVWNCDQMTTACIDGEDDACEYVATKCPPDEPTSSTGSSSESGSSTDTGTDTGTGTTAAT